MSDLDMIRKLRERVKGIVKRRGNPNGEPAPDVLEGAKRAAAFNEQVREKASTAATEIDERERQEQG